MGQGARQRPLSKREQRHPSERIRLSEWVTQASTSPVSANTRAGCAPAPRMQSEDNQFPLSPWGEGWEPGQARKALRPNCKSKPREETERKLAENIMKGGLGKAVKKSLGQRGKERSSKRPRIRSVFTFYHAQWARSSREGLASVHLGDGCQSIAVGALGQSCFLQPEVCEAHLSDHHVPHPIG